jgi:single-strand DNA-binding protein
MANYNKVLLMGNMTRDPQLSYLPSQTPVVEFGLAVNRRWKSKEGEQREDTCFVDCRAFGKPAEIINKYMSKGRGIFVEGRLDFDSWTAQDGSKRSKHRVTVEQFQFLGGGGGGNQSGSYGGSSNSSPQSSAPYSGDDSQQPSSGPSDDDIPF